jgi:hypothetical protein
MRETTRVTLVAGGLAGVLGGIRSTVYLLQTGGDGTAKMVEAFAGKRITPSRNSRSARRGCLFDLSHPGSDRADFTETPLPERETPPCPAYP